MEGLARPRTRQARPSRTFAKQQKFAVLFGLALAVSVSFGRQTVEADLRLLGKVSAEALAAPDGSVTTLLDCETPEQARMAASKFLTDISRFGDDAGLFAVGHRGCRAAAVFSRKGAPALPDGFSPAVTNAYPLWFDRFDNRPVVMGQGGWGHLPTNFVEGVEWSARQGFGLFGANYGAPAWVAPGVWNHALGDAIAAYAKRLGVGYLDYPLMAHAENPAWFWNEVPLPYATGKDGAIAPTSFAYFKYAAHGSDWPMPKIADLIDYDNQACARHYARDDHFIAHFGSVEKGSGQAASLPGFVGDEDIVTMREIVGWKPGVSVDLRGTWTLDDGTNPPRPVDAGDPVLLAYASKEDGFTLTRTFDLAGDLGKARYLHLSCGNWHGGISEVGEVTVNGRAAKDLTRRVPLTGDLDICYDLAGLLRVGTNEIALKGLRAPVSYYAFLGADGRFAYPSDDERKNRAFFALSETAAKRVIAYDARRLRANRAGDPAGRPQFMMCQTAIGDLSFDILRRYGGYQHDTGQTQACWAPWCSRYWKTRGDPVSCENGGVPPDVTRLRQMFTQYLMLGNDAVNLLFDPDMFRANGKGAWIESHRAWLDCLGKHDRDEFDICVMRSIRNASRLRDPNPWRLDPSRGVLQATGRVPGLIDPSDLVADRPWTRVKFIMDAATTILTPEEAEAVARFIRNGGTFIANEHTGRHTHLKRNVWPLFAALGLPAKPVLQGGQEPVNCRTFTFGKGRLVCLWSGAWWRTRDDGRKFNFEDPAQVPALGDLLDRLGVPRTSGGAQLKGMRDCFAEVWRSKNGLYDLCLLALMGGTNSVSASPRFHVSGKVGRLVELSAEGHPVRPFAQDAENRLTLTDVPLEPFESRVYAALREDAGFAPLYWLKSLERRWYALEPVPEAPKPTVAAAAESRFLPLQGGWTHVESGRAVTLGSYVTMGIDDPAEQATFVKRFAVPPAWKGRRVMLKFASQGYVTGLNPRATVKVGGVAVPRTDNLSFRAALPDAGEVTLEVAIDGRLPAGARRYLPSGVHGVFYAEARPQPTETAPLEGFAPGLAGCIRTAFATPATGGRVFLASEAKMNYLLLNGVMLQVPPTMEAVDVTGLLRRDGRPNVLRWWPQCGRDEPDWRTKPPKTVPRAWLELP